MTFPVVKGNQSLPCGHYLQHCSSTGIPVPLTEIHRHWRLEPHSTSGEESPREPTVLEPAGRRAQGLQQVTVISGSASLHDEEESSATTNDIEEDDGALRPAAVAHWTLTRQKKPATSSCRAQHSSENKNQRRRRTRNSGMYKPIFAYK